MGEAPLYSPLRTRCRANMAHVTQSRPDSGLGFQAQVLKTFQVVPSSLDSGEQLLHSNVQQFRGGLVFKAHRLCVSLNSRLESNKEEG